MRCILPLFLLTMALPMYAEDRVKPARQNDSKTLGRELEIASFKAAALNLTPDQLELLRKARAAVDGFRRQFIESPEVKPLYEKLKAGRLTKDEVRAIRSELTEKLREKIKDLPASTDVKTILTHEQLIAFETLRPKAEEELKAKKKSKYVENEPIPEATLEF